jgi:hypothetical protein
MSHVEDYVKDYLALLHNDTGSASFQHHDQFR